MRIAPLALGVLSAVSLFACGGSASSNASALSPTDPGTVDKTGTSSTISFTTGAVASPSTVAAGSPTNLDVSVQASSGTSASVNVDIVDSTGAAIFSTTESSRRFKSGTAEHYTVTWNVPQDQPAAAYGVRISVVSSSTNQVVSQNTVPNAITVQSATPSTPTPTPTPTPSTGTPVLQANFESSAPAGFGGAVTAIALQSAFNATFDWSMGLTDLALVQDGTGTHLRQRYVPSSSGTPVVEFPIPHQSADQATLTYRILFENGWQWVQGGKLPGLAGGTYPTGGQYDENGFSARLMWRPGGSLVVYAYDQDRPTQWGEDFPLMNADGTKWSAPIGKWFTVTERVKMNSTGTTSDGEVEVWVDGVQKLLKQNVRWRANTTYGVDTLLYSSFYGGGDPTWSPSTTTYAQFDDFQVTE